MTANPDHSADPTAMQSLLRWGKIFASSLLLIFSLGLLTGITVAIVEDGAVSAKDVGLIAAGLLLIAGAAYWLWSLKPFSGSDEPISNRTRLTRRYFAISMGLGVILGIGFSLSGGVDGNHAEFYSNGPIPKTPAIILSVLYFLAIPLIGWLWHRTIDEHEAAANSTGALAGLYVYSMITPVWWLGERADFLPPQQPMIVFLIVMLVWGGVWMVKRNG